MADKVRVVDVTARDGLQNEPIFVPTQDKLTLIEKIVQAGVSHLQATSFVHPKWVPQMADAEAVAGGLSGFPGVTFSALVPNVKGYERAVTAGIRHLEFVIAASEAFNRKNLNRSMDESLQMLSQVTRMAQRDGVILRVGFSTCFHCPFEGEISSEAVLKAVRAVREIGPWTVAICDTDGMAFPDQVRGTVGRLLADLKMNPAEIALHFHDTYGRGLANTLAGLDMGIREFDSSTASLGGCPYCPGASGNLATEDLVDFLQGMGYDTGIDMEKLLDAAEFACRFSARPYQGHILRVRRSGAGAAALPVSR